MALSFSQSLGLDAASSAINSLFGIAGNAISYNQQKKLMAKQYQYQKDFYDYTYNLNSPANQVQRLKDAGLNPALAHGTVQNAGGSAGSMPNASAPQSPKMGQMDLLAMEMQRAQIANLEEDTREKRLKNDDTEDQVSTPEQYTDPFSTDFVQIGTNGSTLQERMKNRYDAGRKYRNEDYWKIRNYDRVLKNNAYIDSIGQHSVNVVKNAFDKLKYELDKKGLEQADAEGFNQIFEQVKKSVLDNKNVDQAIEHTKALIRILGLQEDYQKLVNDWYPWLSGTQVAERIGNLIFNGIDSILQIIPTKQLMSRFKDFMSLLDNGKKTGKLQ